MTAMMATITAGRKANAMRWLNSAPAASLTVGAETGRAEVASRGDSRCVVCLDDENSVVAGSRISLLPNHKHAYSFCIQRA